MVSRQRPWQVLYRDPIETGKVRSRSLSAKHEALIFAGEAAAAQPSESVHIVHKDPEDLDPVPAEYLVKLIDGVAIALVWKSCAREEHDRINRLRLERATRPPEPPDSPATIRDLAEGRKDLGPKAVALATLLRSFMRAAP